MIINNIIWLINYKLLISYKLLVLAHLALNISSDFCVCGDIGE